MQWHSVGTIGRLELWVWQQPVLRAGMNMPIAGVKIPVTSLMRCHKKSVKKDRRVYSFLKGDFLMWPALILCCLFICGGAVAGEKEGIHLMFHAGFAVNGKTVVGGTLINKGQSPLEGGYVVVLPVSAGCRPLSPELYSFGPLAPAQKISFRVPVPDSISAYRITSFAAWDDKGFAIPVTDETQAVIASRMPDDRKRCESQRKSQPAQ